MERLSGGKALFEFEGCVVVESVLVCSVFVDDHHGLCRHGSPTETEAC